MEGEIAGEKDPFVVLGDDDDLGLDEERFGRGALHPCAW